MKFILIGLLLTFALDVPAQRSQSSEKELLTLSESLLLAVKRQNPVGSLRIKLNRIASDRLEQELKTDDQKKAFWLNIYNAYFQLIARADIVDQDSIFTRDLVRVAGRTFSFDDIEHGILRGKSDYKFEDLAVKNVDYRIHFALNCGAKSCPPIAFYSATGLDKQLEQATNLYLRGTTRINHESNTIHVTELMDWFVEDFGGPDNLKTVLRRHLQQEIPADYNIQFIPFDWTEQLSYFKR